jgi:hypothetical protein
LCALINFGLKASLFEGSLLTDYHSYGVWQEGCGNILLYAKKNVKEIKIIPIILMLKQFSGNVERSEGVMLLFRNQPGHCSDKRQTHLYG